MTQTQISRNWTLPVVALVLSGAGLIVAPFLPFITATAALVGTLSRTGVELIGPEVFVLCIVGAFIAVAGYQRAGGYFRSKGSVIIPGVIALALAGWYFYQVNDRVGQVNDDAAIASIGTGMWLAIASAIVATIVGLFSTPTGTPTSDAPANPA